MNTAWVNAQCAPAEKINGEIGTLTRVIVYPEIPKKLFLIMELEQERYHKRYMGCLFCGDAAFCRQLNEILHTQLGQLISNIGDLDLSHTL